jgi:hypothetical protein
MRAQAMGSYQKAAQNYSQNNQPLEAENATRMAQQLWETLQGDEEAPLSPLIEEKPAALSSAEGAVFKTVGFDEHMSAHELKSIYKAARALDPHNQALVEKAAILEKTLVPHDEKQSNNNPAFTPVTAVELAVLLSPDEKKILASFLERGCLQEPNNARYAHLTSALA